MKDCPRCGNPVPDNAMFCGSCGATISTTPPKSNAGKPKVTGKNLCPECGKPRSESGKFCLGCGTPLDPEALSGIRTTPVSPQKGGFLRFLCGVLCVIMFITMMGNAIKSPSSPAYNSIANKENITITVWAPDSDQLEDNNWLVDRQEQFAAQHPEYEITWVNEVCSEADSAEQVASGVVSPDVYMFTSDRLGKLIDANALTPLSAYYASQVRDHNCDLVENSVTDATGEMYGFPIQPNSWFLYYDKSVFNERDVKSLEDMLAKGKVSLTLNEGWYGSCFFLGTGCTIFGQDGLDEAAGFDFSGNKAYDAAKKMLGVINNQNFVIGDMDTTEMVNGEVDAIFTGSWSYNELKEALGNDLGIAPLPTFTYNGEIYQMTAMSGTKCVGVNPATTTEVSKHTLCMDFAAFLASDESQIARYEVNGKIPVSSSALDNSIFQSNELVQAELYTLENCSVLQPHLSKMANYWEAMGMFLNKICAGEINVQNYKNAVNKLNEDLNK